MFTTLSDSLAFWMLPDTAQSQKVSNLTSSFSIPAQFVKTRPTSFMAHLAS
jgi:hypothetical protein